MAGDEKAIDAYNEISEVISARCGVLEEPETDRTASEAVFSQWVYQSRILSILAINPFAYVKE